MAAMRENAGTSIRGLIQDKGLKERRNPSYICQNCGNMLWNFKNDEASGKLVRKCRNCGHEDEMESNLVHVNDLKFAGGGLDHFASADMVKDPCLPRATGVDCNSCHFDEAVFFQKPMRGDSDEGMKLIFMCIRCAAAVSAWAAPAARGAQKSNSLYSPASSRTQMCISMGAMIRLGAGLQSPVRTRRRSPAGVGAGGSLRYWHSCSRV